MTVAGRLRAPLAIAVGLLGVYLLGVWAVWFTPQSGSVAFWWPAAGLSVGMVALAPRRWAPGIAAGIALISVVANVSGGREVDVAVAFGAANAAEALVAGLLLKDLDGRLIRLVELRDFMRLVVAALSGAAVLAVLAGATVVATDGGEFVTVARSLLTSHAAAILVIVPVAMTWRSRAGVAEPWEYGLQITLFVAVTLLAFTPENGLPVAAVGVPFLVWAALRLDPRTVSLELLANAVITILLTSAGRGPYGDIGPGGEFSVQLASTLVLGYILTLALVALPLTLAITQRARSLTNLSASEALVPPELHRVADRHGPARPAR